MADVYVCRELATRRSIPTQEFCVRSDMACGSTIGPILASGLGCRTVDVGAPQVTLSFNCLSLHAGILDWWPSCITKS